MPYELYYWPQIPGRGEYVRLALEEAAVGWVDVARERGARVVVEARKGALGDLRPYAPPILKDGDLVISQTATICGYLARKHGLVGEAEAERLHAQALALTVADLVSEAHDTHHPVGSSLYYEEQQGEAARAAAHFLEHRIPAFLGYLEDVLQRNGGTWMVGAQRSYVDLDLFQTLEGLWYAFPNAMARHQGALPGLHGLRDRVATLPRVAVYLASERRMPFNQDGIFRHYEELDP